MLPTFILICNFAVIVSSASRAGRIIGGEYASEGEFPYAVSIHCPRDERDETNVCGGAIITSRLVLTAANCVNDHSFDELYVVAGVTYLSKNFTDATIYEVQFYDYPPPYLVGPDNYNIALVRTKTDIVFTPYIQPIKMSAKDVSGGSVVTTCGWGRINEGNYERSVFLKKLSLIIMPRKTCRSIWYPLETIHERQMCATPNSFATNCDGDTGGPVVFEGQLVGVVSSMDKKCISGMPTIFTGIRLFLDWIDIRDM